MAILPNGRKYQADVVGKDAGSQGTDLAVLKIDGDDLPICPLATQRNFRLESG